MEAVINEKKTNYEYLGISPDSDISVFSVEADYRRNAIHPRYFVVSDTVKNAKKHFTDRISWLKVYSCEKLNEIDAKNVLNANPYKVMVL